MSSGEKKMATGCPSEEVIRHWVRSGPPLPSPVPIVGFIFGF